MIAAFEQAGAFLSGHFLLTSGRHSDRYMEKFNLLQWSDPTELVCRKMADAMREHQPVTVVGPTTGGVILSYEVARQLGLRGIIAEPNGEGGFVIQRGFRLESGERVLVALYLRPHSTVDALVAAGRWRAFKIGLRARDEQLPK